MLEQQKSKENREPEQTSPEEEGSKVQEQKGEEEYQTIKHEEANDDSEFETEDEEDEGAGGGHPGNMFEHLLRSHGLLGPRGRAQQMEMPRDALHPFVQVLSSANVDDCVQVENASFPEEERASREKFAYRLQKCPELSLGVLSLPPLSTRGDVTRPSLIAHIVATRTTAETVTDAAMALPSNWQESVTASEEQTPTDEGHQDRGRTVAVHTFAVLPEHRGKRVGSMLMQSYIERIKSAKVADRITLLAHGELIPFYEKFGFKNLGPSNARFGGGNWHDMALDFDPTEEDED
ncbi:putative gnat family [Phaeomoniella chlamydospora]|uniref:Putative gnat family n=1 Tax=Phaeomoniella chlamydospora TaxID=158046 RepID=A0A0G2GKU4_PHACM|nr:putative gnat family [Phaeomoniella chlamydospora]